MKAFTITLPATTNFYNLWTQLQLLTGFNPANALVPDRCHELILSSDSAAIHVTDANFANQAGMPLASGATLTLRSTTNGINLKEIYVQGSGAIISGWYTW